MDTGNPNIIASVNNIVDQLSSVFSDVKSFKHAQVKTDKTMIMDSQNSIHKCGVLSIMRLRQLNRLSNLVCKERREATQDRKSNIDEFHLQLQNLRYEVRHLQKETTNCLEFKSKHEEIELHSEDEFLLHCPAPESVSQNPHSFMLNRLEFELQERKRLSSKRKELETLIKKQQDSQNQLEKKLCSLKPSLESLKASAIPLQEFFSPSLVWEREQYELAHCLPLPLYMLYVQSLGYGKSQDKNISFSIVGDKDGVASFKYLVDRAANEETAVESDHEEEPVAKKKKKRKGRSSVAVDSEPTCCKAFPLSVCLTISDEAGNSVGIVFNHLPFFNVTCASVSSITFAKSFQADKVFFIDKSSFLHCLYESDSGRTSPNALVSSQIRKLGGDNFSAAVRKYGFPFKWVQRVCGILSPSDILNESQIVPDRDIAADNISKLVAAIRYRLNTQQCLARQLASLDKLKLDTSNCSSGCTSSGINVGGSQLIRWSQVPVQELHKLGGGGLIKFNYQERVNRFFLATFQNGEARLQCIVCITPNYPHSTPVISLTVELTDKHKEPYTIQHKNMEAEVNINLLSEEETMRNENAILSAQMGRLKSCFDSYVYWKRNSSVVCAVRGKGRLFAFDH